MSEIVAGPMKNRPPNLLICLWSRNPKRGCCCLIYASCDRCTTGPSQQQPNPPDFPLQLLVIPLQLQLRLQPEDVLLLLLQLVLQPGDVRDGRLLQLGKATLQPLHLLEQLVDLREAGPWLMPDGDGQKAESNSLENGAGKGKRKRKPSSQMINISRYFVVRCGGVGFLHIRSQE